MNSRFEYLIMHNYCLLLILIHLAIEISSTTSGSEYRNSCDALDINEFFDTESFHIILSPKRNEVQSMERFEHNEDFKEKFIAFLLTTVFSLTFFGIFYRSKYQQVEVVIDSIENDQCEQWITALQEFDDLLQERKQLLGVDDVDTQIQLIVDRRGSMKMNGQRSSQPLTERIESLKKRMESLSDESRQQEFRDYQQQRLTLERLEESYNMERARTARLLSSLCGDKFETRKDVVVCVIENLYLIKVMKLRQHEMDLNNKHRIDEIESKRRVLNDRIQELDLCAIRIQDIVKNLKVEIQNSQATLEKLEKDERDLQGKHRILTKQIKNQKTRLFL